MVTSDEEASSSAPSRRGADTTERILDAAEACFAQKGYTGTTLRDVAELVGIRIPSLYNHFSNKQALYRAVLARGIQPVLESLADYVAAGRERQEPDAIMLRLMEVLHQRPNLPKLVQYELLSGGEQLAELMQDWLRPIVGQGLGLLQSGPAARHWKPEQLPLLLMAIYNIVVGHFTVAPLYELLSGEDPLSDAALSRQSEFFGQVVMLLMGREDHAEIVSESASTSTPKE
jgi:AcrR family transcriptional regulator